MVRPGRYTWRVFAVDSMSSTGQIVKANPARVALIVEFKTANVTHRPDRIPTANTDGFTNTAQNSRFEYWYKDVGDLCQAAWFYHNSLGNTQVWGIEITENVGE